MINKLAIVSWSLQGDFGGIRLIEQNIKQLSAMGCEVHVFAQQLDEQRFGESGAELHKITRPRLTRFRRIQWFDWRAHRLTRRGFDLVAGHGMTGARDVVHIHNCPALEAERTDDPSRAQSPAARYQLRTLNAGRFSRAIANSRLMARDLAERHGIAEERLSVVYPGVDIDQFAPQDEAFSKAVRARHGLPPDKVLLALVTSGNFVKRGVDRLLRALAQLPQAIAERAELLVVGNERAVATYREQAAHIGMKTHFLPSQPDIQNLFAAVDVVVYPARVEEFGMVLLEAMACAKPMLLNEWVGAAELIPGPWRHYVDRDHEDSDTLSAQIGELIQAPDLRQAFGSALREVACQHTWRHNVQEHLKIYEQVRRLRAD